MGERATPTIANSVEIAPSRERCAMAGARSLRVKSPEAPKITSVQGGRMSSSLRISRTAAASAGGSSTAAVVISSSPPPRVYRAAKSRDYLEPTSRDADRLFFFHECLQQRVVRVGELLDPLVLELAEDLLLVDRNVGEALERVARAGQVVVNPNLGISVVPVRVE